MMKGKGFVRWLVIALALVLTAGCAAAEFSADRRGSIQVYIHTGGGAEVAKAHLKLYKVGDARTENGALVFDLTADFAGSGADLTDLSDPALAGKLDAWAGKAEGFMEADTDGKGRATFDGVPVGLYLVRQEGFSGSEKVYFSQIDSFLVMMPMTNDAGTGWTYTIEAAPKVNPLPTPTPAPTEPPADDKLPQTGLQMWLVVAMAFAGVLLFATGWALAFMGRRSKR